MHYCHKFVLRLSDICRALLQQSQPDPYLRIPSALLRAFLINDQQFLQEYSANEPRPISENLLIPPKANLSLLTTWKTPCQPARTDSQNI
jgi:hypothetical protein